MINNGFFKKYKVERTDGKSDERITGYEDRGSGAPIIIKPDYFVLKLNSGNKYEIDALEAYAKSCKEVLPRLSADLFQRVLHYREEHHRTKAFLEDHERSVQSMRTLANSEGQGKSV